MNFVMYMPHLVCLHAFFSVLAVLDLGVLALLILALCGKVVVTPSDKT